MKLIQDAGGRKFLFSLLLEIGLFALIVLGKIDASTYLQGSLIIFGLFASANVASKFSPQG